MYAISPKKVELGTYFGAKRQENFGKDASLIAGDGTSQALKVSASIIFCCEIPSSVNFQKIASKKSSIYLFFTYFCQVLDFPGGGSLADAHALSVIRELLEKLTAVSDKATAPRPSL